MARSAHASLVIVMSDEGGDLNSSRADPGPDSGDRTSRGGGGSIDSGCDAETVKTAITVRNLHKQQQHRLGRYSELRLATEQEEAEAKAKCQNPASYADMRLICELTQSNYIAFLDETRWWPGEEGKGQEMSFAQSPAFGAGQVFLNEVLDSLMAQVGGGGGDWRVRRWEQEG